MFANVSGILARMQLRLLEFASNVVYWAGIKYQALDALSSLKSERTEKTNHDNELLVLMIN